VQIDELITGVAKGHKDSVLISQSRVAAWPPVAADAEEPCVYSLTRVNR
jgi:hypothetical protein